MPRMLLASTALAAALFATSVTSPASAQDKSEFAPGQQEGAAVDFAPGQLKEPGTPAWPLAPGHALDDEDDDDDDDDDGEDDDGEDDDGEDDDGEDDDGEDDDGEDDDGPGNAGENGNGAENGNAGAGGNGPNG